MIKEKKLLRKENKPFVTILDKLIEEVAEGNESKFARMVGVTRPGVVKWRKGVLPDGEKSAQDKKNLWYYNRSPPNRGDTGSDSP